MFLLGVLMILSLAAEFSRMRNPMIIDRPSDNTEIPRVRLNNQFELNIIFHYLDNPTNARCTRKT
jgi:hypothetical protein